MSIVPFTFPDTGQDVRTVTVEGEPWFVVADACHILGLSNPTMAAGRVDEDDLSTAEVIDSMGRSQRARITNEPGLYELIFQSRKSEARAFKRWVTHEVLPAIRTTGRYEAPVLGDPLAELERQTQLTARAIEIAKSERARAEAAEERAAELAPAAHSWEVLASAEGDYAVTDAAKILSRDPVVRVGRNRLFTFMQEQGWVYRQVSDGRFRPKQYAVERGWLLEMPKSHYHPRTGELVLDAPQVRVTVKGLNELHKRLGGQQVLASATAAGVGVWQGVGR